MKSDPLEIGSARPCRLHVRLRTDSPSPPPWAPPGHPGCIAAETWLLALRRTIVRLAGGIREIQNMMDNRPRRRLHINSGDPFVFGEPKRHRDIAIDVRTVRGDVVSGGHFDDQIRFAEHPARREFRRHGRVDCFAIRRRIAFRHSLPHPCLYQSDLAVFETPLVLEGIRTGFGFPRRHEARGGDGSDCLASLGNILIREE